MNPLHGFVEKNCNVFTIRILAVHGKTSTIGCCCLINRVWFGILIHRKICTTIPLVFLPGSKCHWKPGPSNSKSNIETSLESSYHLSQLLPARWPGTSLKSGAIAILVSGLVSIAFFCLPKKALMCHKLKAMQKVSAKENSWFRNCAKKFEHVSNEPQCVFDTRRLFWDFYKHRQLCWQCEWCCLRSELLHHQPPPKRKVNETHHVP